MLKATASAASRGAGRAWSSRLRSLSDARYLALLSAAATYALIVLGGAVRATDSGLACPDWPRCHGELIPPLEGSVLIEYSHRVAAAGVGLLIVGTALAAWVWFRDNRFVLAGTGIAVVLLIAQVLVGAVTVDMELPDTIVALHLSIALVTLAVLLVTAVAAIRHERVRSSGETTSGSRTSAFGVPALTAAAALATFALILVGSYVANSGAALVYPDWPLFDGRLVSAGGRLADLHYAHRLLAGFVGLLLLAVALQTWRRARRPVPMAVAVAALVTYVAEVFLGAGNIWLELATEVRIAHLALASALWSVLVFGIAWWYAERGGVLGGRG